MSERAWSDVRLSVEGCPEHRALAREAAAAAVVALRDDATLPLSTDDRCRIHVTGPAAARTGSTAPLELLTATGR